MYTRCIYTESTPTHINLLIAASAGAQYKTEHFKVIFNMQLKKYEKKNEKKN